MSTPTRSSRVVAVSLPPEAAADFGRVAEEEGRNRSELFREMLRVYLVYRETHTFESLQRYGAARARQRGVLHERGVGRVVRNAGRPDR
jgi:metal-responsive CopG/Arc/MetJ family transcriptional regulator